MNPNIFFAPAFFPSFFLVLVKRYYLSGYSVLHTEMVVEKLGGGEDNRLDDGPGHWGGVRGREEAEEKAAAGLPVRQPEEPQLVGLQILLL